MNSGGEPDVNRGAGKEAPVTDVAELAETEAAEAVEAAPRPPRHRAKHRLGQNFLKDQTVIDKIVDGAELTKEDQVLEIGPGLGVLTEAIAPHAGKLVAVELDRALQEHLAQDHLLENLLPDGEQQVVVHFDSQLLLQLALPALQSGLVLADRKGSPLTFAA